MNDRTCDRRRAEAFSPLQEFKKKTDPTRSAEASPPICPPWREEREERARHCEEMAEDGTRTREYVRFALAHKFVLVNCSLVLTLRERHKRTKREEVAGHNTGRYKNYE